MIELLKTIGQVFIGFFVPIYEAFFKTEHLMAIGIFFLILLIFGGVMTRRERRKSWAIACMIAGFVGTLLTLASYANK